MSYDIYLRRDDVCLTCKRHYPEPELPDPTYNLTPIFDRALTGEELPNPHVSEMAAVIFHRETDRPRGLRLLSGKSGKDTVQWLEKALGHLKDPENAEMFRKLEPENKWGTLEGAIRVMGQLLDAAREYPENVWEIR